MKKIHDIIVNGTELTPVEIAAGSALRPPAGEIDAAFSDIDRIARERRKMIQSTKGIPVSLADLIEFKRKTGFIKKLDLDSDHPIILLQDEKMIELAKKGEFPMETDTVESYFLEKNNVATKQPNLTITSTYDPVAERWVPIQISVLFGRTIKDYRRHWDALIPLICTDYESWEDVKLNFPGNTSDFADAIMTSFFQSMREYLKNTYDVTVPDADLNDFYDYCRVHFKRHIESISKLQHIVPRKRRQEFKDLVYKMMELKQGKSSRHVNIEQSVSKPKLLPINSTGY